MAEQGLGRRLMGLFVETDEGGGSVTAQPIAQPKSVVATASNPSVAAYVDTSIDPEIVKILEKVIAGRKTPYTALLEAASKLQSVIPDENTRLKAAFAMVTGEGQRTLDNMIQAMDVHIADMDGELMRFKKSTEGALTTKVLNLRAKVASIGNTKAGTLQSIANLEAEIEKQRQSIIANDNEIAQLTSDADIAEAEINGVTERFNKTVDHVKADLVTKKSSLASALA